MVAVQERTVSVWNGQIQPRVKIAGDGPPLVFFHGPYGLVWDAFLDALAQHHTIYAPAHPGTSLGDPDAIKLLDDFWDLVLYYDELFDQLGLEAPAVVGHSFGGMVAAEIAATFSRRVSRLVLISPLGLWRDDTPVPNLLAMPPDAMAKALFYDPAGRIAAQTLALPNDPEAQINAQIQRTWTLGCVGKFIWPLPDRGLKKRLHRIQAPTLIIWGEQDKLVPPIYAQTFADRIALTQVHIVEQAAHMPHLEQLATVSGIVQGFLKD
jgi:pimeloyl-ACP methyl ester carboxylesterase